MNEGEGGVQSRREEPSADVEAEERSMAFESRDPPSPSVDDRVSLAEERPENPPTEGTPNEGIPNEGTSTEGTPIEGTPTEGTAEPQAPPRGLR